MPREKSRYRDKRSSSISSESSHERKKSKNKHKRRSRSRDRSESSSHRRKRSTSRSRHKRKSYSRSTSRDRYESKSKRRSRSREKPLPFKTFNLDDTETKLEKAIKAAEAAGLTMTKIPTYEYKEVEVKEDMPTIHDRNLLAEFNSDSFVQKSFTSSKNKKQNIVIDLNAETVTVPEADIKIQKDDSIIDFSAIPSEEELMEMWIKKLYHYRKKMIKGEL